jgi:hypothetical protein
LQFLDGEQYSQMSIQGERRMTPLFLLKKLLYHYSLKVAFMV